MVNYVVVSSKKRLKPSPGDSHKDGTFGPACSVNRTLVGCTSVSTLLYVQNYCPIPYPYHPLLPAPLLPPVTAALTLSLVCLLCLCLSPSLSLLLYLWQLHCPLTLQDFCCHYCSLITFTFIIMPLLLILSSLSIHIRQWLSRLCNGRLNEVCATNA